MSICNGRKKCRPALLLAGRRKAMMPEKRCAGMENMFLFFVRAEARLLLRPEKRSIPHTGGKMNAPESMMRPPCAKIPVPSCPDSGPSLGSGLFFRGFRRAVPGHEDVFHGFCGSCACAARENRCGARCSEKRHAQEAGHLRLCVPAYERTRFSTRKKRILCVHGRIFLQRLSGKRETARAGAEKSGEEKGIFRQGKGGRKRKKENPGSGLPG